MFMKGAFILYLSLSLGYGLCVIAKKQKDILRTLGYTLGISILVLSLGNALVISYSKKCHKPWGDMKKCCCKMMMEKNYSHRAD